MGLSPPYQFSVSPEPQSGYTGQRNGLDGGGVQGAISQGDLYRAVREPDAQHIVGLVLLERPGEGGVTFTPYLRLSGTPRSWVAISKWGEVGIRSWTDPRRLLGSFRKDYLWGGTSVLLITMDDPLARKLGPAGPFAAE